MEKLRIYITQMGHPSHRGGGNAVANNLAQFLTKRGHQVSLICVSPKYLLSEKPNVNYRLISKKVSRNPIINCFNVFVAVKKLVKNDKGWPDIVLSLSYEGFFVSYFHDSSIFIAAVHNFMRFVGIKDLLRAKWLNPLRLGELFYLFSIFLDRLSKLRADYVQVLCEFGRKQCREIYNVPDKKIFIVPNGVDENIFQPRPMPNVKTILFVGGSAHHKGLDILIMALPLITGRYPDVSVLVIGEVVKRRKEALVKLAEELGVTSYISWLGLISRPEAAKLFKSVYLLALPSRLDLFPVAVLEAMFSGVPVVAARVGGVPEIITDGKDGFIINKEDSTELAGAIVRLFDSPGLAEEMGKRGRAVALEKFTFDKVSGLYEEKLERLLISKENV